MHNDLQKKFESLPEDLKGAITSVDFAKSLQEIGKSSNLRIDQLDQLFEEVGYVMLGETHPNEFGKKIGSLFNLKDSERNLLVQAVDEKIFRPIRNSLMSLYNKAPLAPAPSPSKVSEGNLGGQVIPHEADYGVSREKILSEIENPVAKKEISDYSPRRNFEATDPKEYLEQRDLMIEKMKSAGNAGINSPKKSLAEEAVVMAQKKVAPAPNASMPPISTQNPLIVQKPAPSIEIKKPLNPISPMEKLSNVVRVERQSVTIGANSMPNNTTSKASDPYREVV